MAKGAYNNCVLLCFNHTCITGNYLTDTCRVVVGYCLCFYALVPPPDLTPS